MFLLFAKFAFERWVVSIPSHRYMRCTTVRRVFFCCFFFCFVRCFIRFVCFFLSSAVKARLDLGKKGLELAALFKFEEVVAAANVVLADKDVGDSALASQLLEVGLDGGTVLFVIELNDIEGDVKRAQQALGLGAIGAVRLGEDHDGVFG